MSVSKRRARIAQREQKKVVKKGKICSKMIIVSSVRMVDFCKYVTNDLLFVTFILKKTELILLEYIGRFSNLRAKGRMNYTKLQ